jgi:glycosyltransferase involved in cell wall biosynthesis
VKILYVSQYYPPEIGAPAARVSELAREWAARGHQVTVLTAFPQHPFGRKLPSDRGVLTRRERDGDVEVVRTYIFAGPNAGFWRRIASFVSFMLSAMLIGPFRVGKPDVVIATSPQLFTAIAGRWISWLKRVPFVFEVRDLWPESIVEVGAMRPGRAIRILKRLAAALYHSADRVVTVGRGYRRRVLRNYRVPAGRIEVVTNGVDLELFQFSEAQRRQVRQAQGWDHEFVVMYLGTLGMAHGLEFVLEAAERMNAQSIAERPAPLFVLVGDGAERAKLESLARQRGLERVQILPAQAKDQVVGLYAAADVCLVPLRRVELFTDVLPSKMFEIMAMQRPVVVSVDGEARQEIEQAGAGVFVQPESVAGLIAAVERLRSDPDLSAQFGRAGRKRVEKLFNRRVLARRYLRILDQLLSERRPAPTTLPLPADAPRRAAA